MVDERITRFIAKHHVLTLVTVGEGGEAWVANCFYAYDRKRNLFIFTSDSATRHGAEISFNPRVALSVVRETRIVGCVQGAQIVGNARPADDEAHHTYIKRFPYAVVAPLTLWMVEPTLIKFTDNTLGFGKKLIWQKEEL